MDLKVLNKKTTKRWQIWVEQSKYDLDAASLSLQNGFHEWASFQSQQCVEKVLKAVIVKAGYRAPKIHKLAILMSFCNRSNDKFRNTKFEFRDIEAFTYISRYPFLIPGENSSPHNYITKDDAEICLAEATTVFNQVIDILNNNY